MAVAAAVTVSVTATPLVFAVSAIPAVASLLTSHVA